MKAIAYVPAVFGWFKYSGDEGRFVIYNNLKKESNLYVCLAPTDKNTILVRVIEIFSFEGKRIIHRVWNYEVFRRGSKKDWTEEEIITIISDRLARVSAKLIAMNKGEYPAVSISRIYKEAFCCDFKTRKYIFVKIPDHYREMSTMPR